MVYVKKCFDKYYTEEWIKLYRIANPQNPGTITEGAVAKKNDTDWSKFLICQQVTGEILRCPAKSNCSVDGLGYKTLANNLMGFKNIHCLAPDIS